MKKNLTSTKHFIVCLFMLTFSNVDAQNVATFLMPQPTAPANCNDSWTEDGIPLQILPHFPSGSCSFDYTNTAPGDLWLFPARLGVDLTVFTNGIDSIRIIVTDFCSAAGCTNGTITNGGNIEAAFQGTGSGPQDWLWENTNQVPVDLMQLQSNEAQFHEILIYPTMAPPQPCPAIEQVGVEEGDIFVKESCHGVILTSPNGTCYRIIVDDNGGLHTEQVTCP